MASLAILQSRPQPQHMPMEPPLGFTGDFDLLLKVAVGISGRRSRMSVDRRIRRGEALLVVGMQDMNIFEAAMSGKSAETIASGARARLAGKTATEVIAEADRITAERAAKERAEAQAELAKLEAAEKAVREAQVHLAKFEILEARLTKSGGFMPSPVIIMKVRNSTPHPVRRGYFHGRVTSSGRSVPWIEADFNYEISGGVEPGEEQVWRLSPNMFSEWATDIPKDAGLKVDVVKLEGPDGKPLFTVSPNGQTRPLKNVSKPARRQAA